MIVLRKYMYRKPGTIYRVEEILLFGRLTLFKKITENM